MLCTKIVFCFCFDIQNNICTQHVLNLYFSCGSMNNLSSYCGLTDSRMRASDTDLPVKVFTTSNLTISSNIFFCLFAGSIIHDINVLVDIIMQPLIETLITMDKGILSSIVVSIYLAYSFLQNGKLSSLA